jgi:hypothetical protein
MNPSNNAPKPSVVTYKLPWLKIILLGFFMEIGIFVAPLGLVVLGWGLLPIMLVFGGWAGIQALVDVLLGVVAFGYLQRWLVPHPLPVVVIPMGVVWALQVSVLTGNAWLGRIIPDKWLFISVLIAGPVLALITALIAYRVPLKRS